MLAITVKDTGGPEVLRAADLPVPQPGAGEVLVRQRVAGINFIDTSFRSGRTRRRLPFVPGREGVGVVEAVGESVTDVRIGERVGYSDTPHLGAYAEYNVVPVEQIVPIPDDVDDETACALMLQGITAQYLCTSTYQVAPGDSVLVHAAAGGVGSLLAQLVKRRGGRVIATAGGPLKVTIARETGADEVIDYDAGDFAEAVQRFTGGEGVAVAYDGVGAATWQRSLASLRKRGMLVLYGASSGRVPPFDIQRLSTAGSLYLTRPTATDYTSPRSELLARADDLFAALREGALRVRIGARYPLREAARAHRDLESRKTIGKLILTI